MVNKVQVENDVLEILTIADKVVGKTEAFKVDEKNYREYRISVLSVAKLVQDQYNREKDMEYLEKAKKADN
jgi:hypothetical protein